MEVVNLEVEEMEGVGHVNKKMKKEDGSAAAAAVVRWERFLPTTVLRVLLVEADDSTRQIIAALLRKCSYRGRFGWFLAISFIPLCAVLLRIWRNRQKYSAQRIIKTIK